MSDIPVGRSSYLESEDMNSLLHNLLESSFDHQPFTSHQPNIGTSSGIGFADPEQGFMADARVYDIDEFDSDLGRSSSSSYLESEDMNSLLHNVLETSFSHQPNIGTSSGIGFADPEPGFMSGARVYDIDDFDSDCKGAEVSEGPSDPGTRRSAKRTRAADVHNLSEKRRRSRINEKMKALQKLIPNSNKTDKASMLDEAIEYLKELQLQVQMLSMRNGVSLFPYSMHGPQLGIAAEEHELMTSRADPFSRNKEISLQVGFDGPVHVPPSNQPNLLFPISDINNSKTLFGAETSARQHFHTLNHLASSKDICQVSQLHLDMKCSGKNSSSGVSS